MNECERIISKGVFHSSFLEPETRCGYDISSQMKAVWMIELDILMEAQRVFEKYDIRFESFITLHQNLTQHNLRSYYHFYQFQLSRLSLG